MKLTALLLIIVCMQVSANSYSQTVSFSGKNVPLKAVFASIEKQTGLSFFFNYSVIKDARPVTLDVQDAPFEELLKEALKDQGLDFYRTGKTIFIVKKQVATISPSTDGSPEIIARQIDVKGRVMNEQGEPLVGATVFVKNGKRATVTNEKGEFELKNLVTDAVLDISFTGYEKREVGVVGQNSIVIRLAIASNSLDEAQVIAYGTTTQRMNVGNVTTVSGEDIQKQPVANPLLALEGRVPGMFITQNTGVAGGSVNVQIRGQNSIANGNDPFYVIDGVPYTSTLLPNLGVSIWGSSPNGTSGSPFNYLNPSDIESISILKDADATAIYGSRGANGVVLITTKKGKAHSTNLDINVYSGVGKVSKKMNWLNTSQYLAMRHEAFGNDGVTPDSSSAPDLFVWDTTRYTDWQKMLMGGSAATTDAQANLSGGNTNTQYLFGGGYHHESTVFPFSGGDQKGSVHLNVTNASGDQRFRMSVTANYVIDNSNLPSTDLTSSIQGLPPDAPKPLSTDGTLNWANSTWPANANPLAITKQIYKANTTNLISSAVLSYHVLRGLEINSNLGYTDMQINEYSLLPTSSFNPSVTKVGSASFTNNNIRSWIIEPQGTYKLSIGHSRLDALIGMTIEKNSANGQLLSGKGYTSDALLTDIQAAPIVQIGAQTTSTYRYNALFGKINCNIGEKYLLDFTMRRDGSSRFGPNNQFKDFGAGGAAWIFSKEDFMRYALPFLSFGKLRASYGTTGSDQIGDYRFYDLFNPTYYSYQGTGGLTPVGLANPNLQWEETKKAEGGIELGFLKDKILLNTSYYHNRSSNQLLSSLLPTVTGFRSFPINLPATVQNTGWEFTLKTTNIKSKYFSWTSSINLTIPRNKLVSFPNFLNSPFGYMYVIGKPITISKVFHSIGVNDSTGIYEFSDNKGSPTYNPSYSADETHLINTAPKFYGGFQNAIGWKGFRLDFIFQFTKQTGNNYLFQTSLPGTLGANQLNSILNRWQKPGDKAPIQQFSQNYGSAAYSAYTYAQTSDYAYTDVSYIRLKNLSFSYQLSDNMTRKMHLKSLLIYLHGQNLLTITKYKGFDPETQSLNALPPLRVVTGGIQLSL